MKRFFVLLLFSCLVFSMLSACGNSVPSVDLSEISFDEISVGDEFAQVETGRYHEKNSVSNQYTYNYEEWRLSVAEGVITEIMATFSQIDISINGRNDCSAVDDVTAVLGEDCTSSWYDREQSLMQLQYFDKEHGLQCSFIYNKHSETLVWAILQKT